ncbi:hypothetical protein KA005_04600 [bacterium]|nr:hypothetical protein [bacterium]
MENFGKALQLLAPYTDTNMRAFSWFNDVLILAAVDPTNVPADVHDQVIALGIGCDGDCYYQENMGD